MKLKDKYLYPVAVFLCVYIFGLLIYQFSVSAVNAVYTYLNYLFPDTFSLYTKLAEKEALAELQRALSVWGLFLAMFLINLIALRLDNKKYERLVILTDGQFLITDGIRLYFKECFTGDLISSLIIPALLVIPAYFIPEKIMEKFGLFIFLWLGETMKYNFNIVMGMLTAAAFSLVGRILAVPICLKSWRAAWLSDI